MKGLLIKDYKLMLGQKTFLGMAALMSVLYLAIYKDPTFAVVFITVMCTMFTVSTLSYDEYENGMAYLFTLPISRNKYELEIKYENISVPEVNVENSIVEILLPNKYRKIDNRAIIQIVLNKLIEKVAQDEIEMAMEKARVLLGFAPEDYAIKRMPDTFIKNARNKTIIINPDITKYSRKIIETSLIQAFCKTKHKENSKEYKVLLKNAIEKYENYEYRIIKVS